MEGRREQSRRPFFLRVSVSGAGRHGTRILEWHNDPARDARTLHGRIIQSVDSFFLCDLMRARLDQEKRA